MSALARFMHRLEQVRAAHVFDKTPTVPIIVFEACVLAAVIAGLIVLFRQDRLIVKKFFVAALGVLIFELFTGPMWNNLKMGPWAYLFKKVSWILTFGWAGLVVLIMHVVDRACPGRREFKKFFVFIPVVTALVVLLESLVISLGIRTYAPEIEGILCGVKLLSAPIEVLYYVPVFMGLVYAFSRYWIFYMEGQPIIPIKDQRWLRNALISYVAVLLFEVMIDPLVVNADLPRWSYVYHDISIVLTTSLVAIVWLVIGFVDWMFIDSGLLTRFIYYLDFVFVLSLPVESWLIHHGHRIYSASCTASFSGFQWPLFHVPIEVGFALPMYFALIISFIRYWQIVLDNEI